MGNFEKLGILVIIMLVVVIMVLMVWGVAQPVGDLGSDLPTPKKLAVNGKGGQEVPQVTPKPDAPSPWADPDPDDDNQDLRPDLDPRRDPDPDPVQSRDITHLVKDGESFYGMALKYYRDGTKYLVIQEANPDINPQTLSVGMEIIIPDPDSVLAEDAPRPAPEPERRPTGNTYLVKKGDSLWKIAEETLGKGTEFPKILDANRDLLGDDGDDLDVGMTLIIPR